MIHDGPPKRIDYGSVVVHLEGPDRIWTFGPLRIEYDHYFGPSFWIGEHECTPRRFSPWWALWRIVRRRMGA